MTSWQRHSKLFRKQGQMVRLDTMDYHLGKLLDSKKAKQGTSLWIEYWGSLKRWEEKIMVWSSFNCQYSAI